jgi:hypothetical protein
MWDLGLDFGINHTGLQKAGTVKGRVVFGAVLYLELAETSNLQQVS